MALSPRRVSINQRIQSNKKADINIQQPASTKESPVSMQPSSKPKDYTGTIRTSDAVQEHVYTQPKATITVSTKKEDSVSIDTIKANALKRIKESYLKAMSGTFQPGIKGTSVKEGTFDTTEEVEVTVPFDRNSIQAFKAKAVIIAEQYASETEEGINVADFTENEKFALSCGYLPFGVLTKMKDVPVVIRDACNKYIEVTFADLLRISHLMECKASDLLSRKWMLDSLIEDLSDPSKIAGINWDSDYDDLDTKGS